MGIDRKKLHIYIDIPINFFLADPCIQVFIISREHFKNLIVQNKKNFNL